MILRAMKPIHTSLVLLTLLMVVVSGCEPQSNPQATDEEKQSLGSGLLETPFGGATIVLVESTGDSIVFHGTSTTAVLRNTGLTITSLSDAYFIMGIKTPVVGKQEMRGDSRNSLTITINDPRATSISAIAGAVEVLELDTLKHIATLSLNCPIARFRDGLRDTLLLCAIFNKVDYISNLNPGQGFGLNSLGRYSIKKDSLYLFGGNAQPGDQSYWASIPRASRGTVFPSTMDIKPTGEMSWYDWDFHEKKLKTITSNLLYDGDTLVITQLDPIRHVVSGWHARAGGQHQLITDVNISIPKD